VTSPPDTLDKQFNRIEHAIRIVLLLAAFNLLLTFLVFVLI
jgi:hypothetical protein